MKFFKKLKNKFEAKTKPVNVSETTKIFDLLDDCIALLNTPDKVTVRYYKNDPTSGVMIVYNGETEIFWMGFVREYELHVDLIKFRGSDFLGEEKKFAELYRLCKKNADETFQAEENLRKASLDIQIAVCAKKVRQYM